MKYESTLNATTTDTPSLKIQ